MIELIGKLWNVLKIYGVRGKLWAEVKVIYREISACVRADGELSQSFPIGVRLRQGCVMSPWLFDIFMDGYMREMKTKVWNIGTKQKINGNGWAVLTCLFADDIVLCRE